jgi:hypothetical protein
MARDAIAAPSLRLAMNLDCDDAFFGRADVVTRTENQRAAPLIRGDRWGLQADLGLPKTGKSQIDAAPCGTHGGARVSTRVS